MTKPCYIFVKIVKSSKPSKKYMALFKECWSQHIKVVHFGAVGYLDYTINKDDARKKRYLKRHLSRENWTDPTTPGALSRWILWNKPTLQASIQDYRKHFKL